MGKHKSKVDRYQCILYCVHVSSINSFFVSSRHGIIFWFVADLIQWGRKCQERNPILMRCLLFSPPLAHLWCNEVIIMSPPCFPMFCVLPRKSALQQQTSYDDGSDASLILLLPFFCEIDATAFKQSSHFKTSQEILPRKQFASSALFVWN